MKPDQLMFQSWNAGIKKNPKLFYISSGDSNVQEEFTANIPYFAGDVKGKYE